jgi:hypothetical protein
MSQAVRPPRTGPDHRVRVRECPVNVAMSPTSPHDTIGPALVALDGEVRKLLDMLRRDRRLWEHAADNLPGLAADVYAAVKAQTEPT